MESLMNEEGKIETFFTAHEVCKFLCISESTLNKLANNKEIGYLPIGGRNRRYGSKDLVNYIQSHRVEACNTKAKIKRREAK